MTDAPPSPVKPLTAQARPPATLILEGNQYELPVIEGTEGERAIDISSLREQTGHITLDPGYGNTGSCQSAITFIDGEKGILRYRGIPIEQFAERAQLRRGRLAADLRASAEPGGIRGRFSDLLTATRTVARGDEAPLRGLPALDAPPMAILSADDQRVVLLPPGAASTSTTPRPPRCRRPPG